MDRSSDCKKVPQPAILGERRTKTVINNSEQTDKRPAQAEWVRLKVLARETSDGTTFAACNLDWVRDNMLGFDCLRMNGVQVDLPDRRGLSGYRICFGQPDRGDSPFDRAEKVVWTLEPVLANGVLTWSVQELGASFPSTEIAEMVVTKLIDYCREYEGSACL
jgi:hypothetical protein